MPTLAERKALIFFAAVALLGAGVRAVRAVSDDPDYRGTARAALSGQIAAVEAARAARVKGKQPAAQQTIDLNGASAAQLQALPRVGPVLARRILEYRDSAGPFRSLQDLDRVKGIGPAMLRELAPRVTFNPSRRP